MSNSNVEQLARVAKEAFNSAPSCYWPDPLSPFPGGWCSDASQVLGAILKDHGHGEFACVTGERIGKSHSWLSRDSLIIDITADQFDDGPPEIVWFSGSPWHRKFKIEGSSKGDYRDIPANGFSSRLIEVDKYIRSHMSHRT